MFVCGSELSYISVIFADVKLDMVSKMLNLCRSMREKKSMALERKVVLVLV